MASVPQFHLGDWISGPETCVLNGRLSTGKSREREFRDYNNSSISSLVDGIVVRLLDVLIGLLDDLREEMTERERGAFAEIILRLV